MPSSPDQSSNIAQYDDDRIEEAKVREEPASWSNMPNKSQLAILALSRLVDFWQMASFQSYMIHQLRSFDSSVSESTISHQAGVLSGSFTAAQIVTCVLWGRAADAPTLGRKNVLLIGLIGTAISCVGVGFADTFWKAVAWRVVGGGVNGTVGAARTMVAESVDKKWHSRAFLLLPLAFNVANILGPLVGGSLVDVASLWSDMPSEVSMPGLEGVLEAMSRYPYALPNLLCAMLLFVEAAAVSLWLRETLPTYRKGRGPFIYFSEMKKGIMSILRSKASSKYRPVATQCDSEKENLEQDFSEKTFESRLVDQLPFHSIWTTNVIFNLLSIAIFDFHMGAFASLWITFLSTDQVEPQRPSLLHFSGGLSFQPATIGLSLSILGITGLVLQLLLYPWANARFGLLRCFRYSLFLFPIAYFLAPYLALLPSSGVCVWIGITFILLFQVSARTFALPATILLLNNSCPHPSVLGTVHGVGQSVSSTFRTLGPIVAGWWFGVGLDKNMVGLGWWGVAVVSSAGCVVGFWVRNGRS